MIEKGNKPLKAHLIKYYCFWTFLGAKSNFVPKEFPIGFEMAEKNKLNLEPNLASLGETKGNNSVILKDKRMKNIK